MPDLQSVPPHNQIDQTLQPLRQTISFNHFHSSCRFPAVNSLHLPVDLSGGGPDNKETKITTMELASTMEKKVTLTFQQFNDANYRAFARLKDGTYVYGEVKYFASA